MKRSPIQRKTGLPRVNRERKSRTWLRQFGSPAYVDHLHASGCPFGPGCWRAMEAAHMVRSRGAGGRPWHAIGAYMGHHLEEHAAGRETFRARYPRVDIEARAAELWRTGRHLVPEHLRDGEQEGGHLVP